KSGVGSTCKRGLPLHSARRAAINRGLARLRAGTNAGAVRPIAVIRRSEEHAGTARNAALSREDGENAQDEDQVESQEALLGDRYRQDQAELRLQAALPRGKTAEDEAPGPWHHHGRQVRRRAGAPLHALSLTPATATDTAFPVLPRR